MMFSVFFSVFLIYFPLCCQSVGKNTEAETHKMNFTANNNDLLLHTKNRTEQLEEIASRSKLVKILESHDLSRRHHVVEQISGWWEGLLVYWHVLVKVI